MPLFGGPSTADFNRLERQFDRIERQLERLVEVQERHADKANGHPAKVIWHGMTWPQLIGLGMLGVILALVGLADVVGLGTSGDISALLQTLETFGENAETGVERNP